LITWQVVIPANTQASVIIPKEYRVEKIVENGSNSKVASEKLRAPLEAGSYTIVLKK
jgi:hypothetical protein